MRTRLKQFCEQEQISRRTAYNEIEAGRLFVVKVGGLVFVEDEDREAWRRTARRVTGRAGRRALQTFAKQLEEIGRALDGGEIDRALVADCLADAARKTGLVLELAA